MEEGSSNNNDVDDTDYYAHECMLSQIIIIIHIIFVIVFVIFR